MPEAHVTGVGSFFHLLARLTAAGNVELPLQLAGVEPGARRERVVEALDAVGLADRMDHFPAQLSGGEQQRVSIARGLVKDPPLLLCDEPTGTLDVETGIRILSLLRRVTSDGDRSVLIVTHNSVIADMADRVLHLRDGEVISDEAVANPRAPEQLSW